MAELNRYIFRGMQILNSSLVKEYALIVEEGLIKAIIPDGMVQHHLPANELHFPETSYLLPGLIDLHVHGVANHDVMDASEAALHAISDTLAQEGVTGFLATTMTAPNKEIENVLAVIASASERQNGAALFGVHLEGPFISKSKIGAQQAEAIQVPDSDLVHRWQKIANGKIKLVTLAPELPEAIQLIKDLKEMGVVASIGHTNATFEETLEAIAAGCQYATHLFNAMRGMQQREPGAAGALLLSDKVNAELIVDGFHLHPAIIDLAFRVKSKERLLLVSDAMRAKCMQDGEYELGGQTVYVEKGKATLADGTLAGSTLRLPQALKKIMEYTNCPLETAVQMASLNPARILGLSQRKGSIEVGKDADLVVMNDKFEVLFTMREGVEVFKAKQG
jgi:N-acetylglucosamine-6-phosphate deacetylase